MKNWLVYYKGFFGIYKKEEMVTYILRNGLIIKNKFYKNSHRIFNEMWIYECYNPKGFKIKEGDTVIDIGANCGYFSLYAATKNKTGKIYAFEPVAENFKILKKNVENNQIKNIVLINKAVSNKTGESKIFINEDCDWSHSTFKNIAGSKKNEKIKTISFKDFIKNNKIVHINFLKIDCEGSEYEIIYGIKDFLKNIDKISGEIHYIDEERNVMKFKKFLEENGFDVIISPNYETKFANLLFAKRR